MNIAMDNTIFVSEKAKAKVQSLMADAGIANDPSYFLQCRRCGWWMLAD